METIKETINNVKVAWSCPSNIAIVKYWGKKAQQIPCNSSLSLTLSKAKTTVEIELIKKKSDEKKSNEEIQLSYFFEDKINDKFKQRIIQFLQENISYFPYLKEYALVIHSFNSFPHSAGIASSASAFGAISVALLDITYTLGEKEKDALFYQLASHLARLGSGSASRSLYAGFALWGNNENIPNSSENYAVEINDIHPVFQEMKDAIIIVDDEPKKVSSSKGHALMNEHPYAQNRFKQANNRTSELISILKTGDINGFIRLCESEALTLHAMMMTSNDYYLLMKSNTIEIIHQIWSFREETQIPVCFTLDAGPNIHVLYPKDYQNQVENFIINHLQKISLNVLFDEEGNGPIKLK